MITSSLLHVTLTLRATLRIRAIIVIPFKELIYLQRDCLFHYERGAALRKHGEENIAEDLQYIFVR